MTAPGDPAENVFVHSTPVCRSSTARRTRRPRKVVPRLRRIVETQRRRRVRLLIIIFPIRFGPHCVLAEYAGEEYEVLLRYVAEEQNKLKNKRKDDGGGDDKDAKYTRKWYSPWKKTKVQEGMKGVGLSLLFPVWC